MEEKETKTIGKKNQINIRATDEEFKMIKEKAKNYPSVSSLLLDAVKGFDNRHGRNRIDRMIEFSEAVNSFDRDMVRIGTNLNQIAHALNLYKYDESIHLPSLEYVQMVIEQNIELDKEILRTIRHIANISRR